MKNTALLVLGSLVMIGIFGTIIVLNTETTGQAFYQIYERPPVFTKVLTTEKCEPVQADTALSEADCTAKGRWDCSSKYPITPGGAENYCSRVCMNQIISECAK